MHEDIKRIDIQKGKAQKFTCNNTQKLSNILTAKFKNLKALNITYLKHCKKKKKKTCQACHMPVP